MKRTSKNYMITIDPFSTTDMEILETIKRVVTVLNKNRTAEERKSYRWRILKRGRKPISLADGTTSYDWGGNIRGGIANASRIDIYLTKERIW